MKGFTDRFTAVVSSKKRVFVFILVLINLVSLIGLFRLNINTDFSLFMPRDSVEYELYEKMNSDFSSGEQLLFLLDLGEHETDLVELSELKTTEEKIAAIPGVKNVSGPVPPFMPSGFGIKKTVLTEESDVKNIMEFEREMGSLGGIFEYEGKHYGMFTVILENSEIKKTALESITGILESTGKSFYASGDLYLQLKILDYIIRIVAIVPPLALILMLLVFRWRVGSFKGTFLAVLPAGLGALWTMGFLGWSGNELSLTSVLVPIFTIVMGSADGLHFMSHYIDNRKSGMQKRECMSDTLKKVGKPMILTTVTTVIGFLSLLVVNSAAMQQMGLFASMGVVFAGIATWVFLPVVADSVKGFGAGEGEGKIGKRDFLDKSLESIWGRKSVMLALALVIAFIPGVLMIKTDFNMLSIYKPETEIRKGIEEIQKITGGGLPLFITYETDGDILGTEYAQKVMAMEAEMLSKGLITKYVSAYDVFAVFNKIIYGNTGYPSNQIQLNLMYGIISAQKNNPAANFTDRNKNLGRLLVFPKDLSGSTLEEIRRICVENSGESSEFTPVGIQYIMKGMNDAIIPEQVKSLLLAVVMVFAIMFVSYRKLYISVFSVIPICLTLVSLFGVMGYADITLSIITSTMASITIGVGIDYAIHFSSAYQFFRREMSSEKASVKAFEYVSKPILANAIGLAVGFTSLVMSPLQIHNYMSLLMWVTMIISSILTLTLLPTLYIKHER